MPSPRTETKYRPEFCQALIEHFEEGYSFASFGGIAGVDRGTLYRWLDEFPDFKKAKARGELASLYFWEGLGIKGVKGDYEKFNAATFIYTMKRRFSKYGYGEGPNDASFDDDPQEIQREETGNLIDLAKRQREKRMNGA